MNTADMQVTHLDHMGDDWSVVNAARVSFDKASKPDVVGVQEWFDDEGNVTNRKYIMQMSGADKKLLRYLATHNHWSPFSHAFASFRIKAPVFVARQLVKHQVGLAWNEVSRRYVDSEPEFYFPNEWRERAYNKKQGSGDGVVDLSPIQDMEVDMNCVLFPEEVVEKCLNTYSALLELQVCPEQARMVLPQNTMTEWIWSGSLYAFARVCNLRLDKHSQQETQIVAKMLDKEMKVLYPESWAVLVKGDEE